MEGLPKKIFFWTLVLLFFVTTPVIILFALGYRFNLERGIFVYTGSLSVEANPLAVDIFMDGQLENKSLNRLNNSYHVGGIKPGEHLIEVKADGFNTWSKKINVSSGTSTEFWNVLLVRNTYDKTAYDSASVQKYFFDPGKKLLAYVSKENDETRVSILDPAGNTSDTVFSSAEYAFTTDSKENIEWSPQSKKIIIPVMKNGVKNYFLVDVKTKESIDLKELAQADEMERVRWDLDNKNYIFYVSGGSLHHLNTLDPADNQILVENIAGYDLSFGYVYYFSTQNGIVYRKNFNTISEPDQITTEPPLMDDPQYQVTVYDAERIALLNRSGELYIHNFGKKDKYFEHLASRINEIQFSNDGKKLLYFSDSAIFVYFTREWEVQPWRDEDEQREIIRFSGKIRNVHWAKDYEHVIFTVGKSIKITEIDNRGQNNTADILNTATDETIVVSDFEDDKLYFMDKNGETNQLFSINFPEETSILGF